MRQVFTDITEALEFFSIFLYHFLEDDDVKNMVLLQYITEKQQNTLFYCEDFPVEENLSKLLTTTNLALFS